jgi:hypothetical protein
MRPRIAASTLFAVSLLPAAPANAAPWCAHYSTGLNDCYSFYSFQQCQAAISGVGGYCARNLMERRYWSGRDSRRRYYRD